MRKIGALLVCIILLLFSCKNSSKAKKFLPPSTGGINSLMVVMDNELWQGSVGDKVRELFATRSLGLPWDEPIFTITQIPPQVFKGGVTNSRSVLFVQQDSISIGHVKKNVYALPQRVAVVKGTNNQELVTNLGAVAPEAIEAFKDVEISEAQKRFTRSSSKENALQNEFGVTMTIPSAYRVGKTDPNFVWIDRQIPKGNMNIIAYTMPMDSFDTDSTFVRDIVKMRDSIGKVYIPGPDVPGKTTYMITEKAFAPYVFPAEIAGKKAAEVRGIWEISGYPMAGPFLTYIINDTENNRKLVIEGFTFAPATQKRDYMFELEAILKTISFDKNL
ncbi:MAG: DUF4837 family protein [Croceitalea sp.]|nr:DUF4837 family protein [Croceitalea sp.]NNC35592.1 DUF4837 family protein [Croceitalea sp.]NNL09001.1 DUF4837 family protein [Croceitalea sp.]